MAPQQESAARIHLDLAEALGAADSSAIRRSVSAEVEAREHLLLRSTPDGRGRFIERVIVLS